MSESRSPSRSSSSSRSKSSERNGSPAAGPERERLNDDGVPSDEEISIECVLRNNLPALEELFAWSMQQFTSRSASPTEQLQNRVSQICLKQHTLDHITGNLLFFAAYKERHEILKYFAQWNFFGFAIPSVIFALLVFQRYAMVIEVLQMAPKEAIQSKDMQGSNILHIACARSKPSLPFLKALIPIFKRGGASLDEKDAKGFTALHLLAIHSKGREGADAARFLLVAGASDEIQTEQEGVSAAKICRNPYVREVLGISSNPKPRPIPLIDSVSKETIDKCANSSQFPPVKSIDIGPSLDQTLHLESTPSAKALAKMGSEALGSMITRLYTQSIQHKEHIMQQNYSKMEEQDKSHSHLISAEEREAAVQRLYAAELAAREQKMEAVRAKYLRDPPEPLKLGPSEIEDCGNRLCKGSLEHARQVHEKLMADHSPPRERKMMGREQMQACAVRLHDESMAKAKESWVQLYQEHCKSPFEGKKKLSQAEVKAVGERLCKLKGR